MDSKSMRSLRKIGCDSIDFAGRYIPNKTIDKKLAEYIKNNHQFNRSNPSPVSTSLPRMHSLPQGATPPQPPSAMPFLLPDFDWNQHLPPLNLPPLPEVSVRDQKKWIDLGREARALSVREFCDHSPFWTDHDIDKCEVDLQKIPHLNMVIKDDGVIQPQFVFGRSGLLTGYRKCDKFFRVLSVGDWTMLFNDLFTYCASHSKLNKFPIRIITHPVQGIHLEDTKQYGIRDYDTNMITSPLVFTRVTGAMSVTDKIDITSRELCQLQKYFRMHFYQSEVDTSIFFASRYGPDVLASELKEYNLKYVPKFVS